MGEIAFKINREDRIVPWNNGTERPGQKEGAGKHESFGGGVFAAPLVFKLTKRLILIS